MTTECCSTGELVGCDQAPLTGSVARLLLHFIDPTTCEPADPDAVIARVKLPDGTTIAPDAVHDSLGEYHADVPVTLAGQHFWRFEMAGDPSTVTEGAFLAASSEVLA